jgi:hypothetical protein
VYAEQFNVQYKNMRLAGKSALDAYKALCEAHPAKTIHSHQLGYYDAKGQPHWEWLRKPARPTEPRDIDHTDLVSTYHTRQHLVNLRVSEDASVMTLVKGIFFLL